MTRTAFLVLTIVITLTLGASGTVIVMTEQDKASAATDDAVTYREQLLESQIAEQRAQTQLGLTREVLTQAQSELETLRGKNSKIQSQNDACYQAGQLTRYLMHAVSRQATAVNLTIRNHRARARQVLHRVSRDLTRAERILMRSGHKTAGQLLAECRGTK